MVDESIQIGPDPGQGGRSGPDADDLSCPVCRARFRHSRACPRCGTELTALMVLAGRAYRLRRASVAALRAGDPLRARELADQAHALHATDRGRRLRAVAALLTRRETPGP